MKSKKLYIFFLSVSLFLSGACSSISPKNVSVNSLEQPEKLYIYEDGRMLYKSRYVSQKDVVIYDDGMGGERAAIKVRVPVHPDFYRDSIVVVRFEDVTGDTVSQQNMDKMDNVN